MFTGNAFPFITFMSLIVPLGAIAGWIILLVVAWRFMKAHDSIADTYKSIDGMMQEIVNSIKTRE